MNECAKCGACTTVCPVYQVTGRESLTARGRLHLFEHIAQNEISPEYAHLLSACLLCGACDDACPRQLDIHQHVIKARQQLPPRSSKQNLWYKISQHALATPGLLSGLSKAAQAACNLFLNRLPEKSGLRYKLSFLDIANWQTGTAANKKDDMVDSKEEPQVAYFSGCFAKYLHTEIASNTVQLLSASDQPLPFTPEEQVCCGLAAWSAGDINTAQKLAQKNIETFEENDLPILTSCASCYTHLKNYPELFKDDKQWQSRAESFAKRVREFTTYFLETFKGEKNIFDTDEDKQTQKIVYHDPCHLRFKAKIIDAPRQLIHLLPQTEIVDLPHGRQCCGHGGLFDLLHPDLSSAIMAKLVDDFETISADTIVTTCTGCLIQWHRNISAGKQPTNVMHLATLLAKSFHKNASGS